LDGASATATPLGTVSALDGNWDALISFSQDAVAGRLLVSAWKPGGVELWVTDGTADGTRMIRSFANPPGFCGATIRGLEGSDTIAYFSVSGACGIGSTIWRTDLTDAGTYPLETAVRGEVVAAISGNRGFAVAGDELWQLEDQPPYATLVADLFPGPERAYPYDFITTVPNRLLFFATDPYAGHELFVLATDGLMRDGFE
jgi:ELWxxDGT repeat protein